MKVGQIEDSNNKTAFYRLNIIRCDAKNDTTHSGCMMMPR